MSEFAPFMLEDGTLITINPNDFLVFIDETGGERMGDPNYPMFGLGGCASRAEYYYSNIVSPWESMKESHFNGRQVKLHASRMRSPSQDQLEAIGNFFRENDFCRLAVCVSKKTCFADARNLGKYQLIARALIERISRVARFFNVGRVILVSEESEKGDRLARQFFDGYRFMKTRDGSDLEIPFQKYRMPKSEGEAALEVADFIMHAAGNQVKRGLHMDESQYRRDYKAVFRSVDERLVAFLDIEKAVLNQSDEVSITDDKCQ
ncbi:MAG: DUF3800 domain-containing protein [Candidatus Zixiibacteriota bacterium]